MLKQTIQDAVHSNDKRIKLFNNEFAKSEVWKYFLLIKYDNIKVDFVCCKKCKIVLAYSARHGTGTLIRHKCLTQLEIAEFKHTTNKRRISKRTLLELARKKRALVARDSLPLSVTEGAGFREYAQALIGVGAAYGNHAFAELAGTTDMWSDDIGIANEAMESSISDSSEHILPDISASPIEKYNSTSPLRDHFPELFDAIKQEPMTDAEIIQSDALANKSPLDKTRSESESEAFEQLELPEEKSVDQAVRRLKYLEDKLKFEKDKMNREMALEEKKLELEEQKIRYDFLLSKLELEQKERTMKYEIDAKYANQKYK